MANIDEFKGFVKENPKLLRHVKDGSMTWQRFYEIYDLYGSENEVWDPYLKTEETSAIVNTATTATTAATAFTLADTINFLKNMDLDSIQNGISSIQRVVGLVSDMTTKSTSNVQTKSEYKPRPLYKHFED